MVTARVLFHHELALPAIPVPWENSAVPFYFFCGLFCAVIGVFVIRLVYGLTAFIKRKIASPHRRVFAGGMTLCVLLAFFPVLRGQGYSFVMGLFSGEMDKVAAGSPFLGHLPFPMVAVLVILAAIFIKAAASVLTVECGGDGGIFAPTMFIGAFTGFAFARLVNLSGLASLQEANSRPVSSLIGRASISARNAMVLPLLRIFCPAYHFLSYIQEIYLGQHLLKNSKPPHTGHKYKCPDLQ